MVRTGEMGVGAPRPHPLHAPSLHSVESRASPDANGLERVLNASRDSAERRSADRRGVARCAGTSPVHVLLQKEDRMSRLFTLTAAAGLLTWGAVQTAEAGHCVCRPAYGQVYSGPAGAATYQPPATTAPGATAQASPSGTYRSFSYEPAAPAPAYAAPALPMYQPSEPGMMRGSRPRQSAPSFYRYNHKIPGSLK